MWVESGDEPQTCSKKMIGDEKVLVSVFWNQNGFSLIDDLPKGVTFTSDYFINNILEKLTKRGTAFPDRDGRLILHFDNARPHFSNKSIQYMELNVLPILPIHQISLHLISFFLDTLKISFKVVHLIQEKSFLMRLDKFGMKFQRKLYENFFGMGIKITKSY